MKNSIFLLLALLILSCQTQPGPNDPIYETEEKALGSDTLSNQTNIKPPYWSGSALFINGSIYQGLQVVQNMPALENMFGCDTLNIVRHDSLHHFLIGFCHRKKESTGTEKLAYITAWKKADGQWRKELDIYYPHQIEGQVDLGEIDKAREKWVELSNAHDHAKLIAGSYTEDAVYVNDGKVAEGAAAITDRYQYMSNPKWQIQLYGKEVVPVQDGIVYEVGQYQSSGVGHYVIVWEKQEDGIWKANFDFNF